jgi:uncharacterized coiled-coil protein SlyX
MNDDDIFSNIQDPFQRLNEMEEGLLNHAHHIEQMVAQLSEHGDMMVKISQTLKYLSSNNSSLHQQTQALHHRIKTLEIKLNEK